MPAIQFKALDNKAADSAIKSIATRGKALRQFAHQTAVGILMHYDATGDYTKFAPLYLAIKAGMGNNMARGLERWIIKHSALESNPDLDKDARDAGKLFVHVKNNGKKNNVEGSKVEAFYAMEPETSITPPFDLQKAVNALIRRALTEANKDEKNMVNDDLLDDLLTFAEEHKVEAVAEFNEEAEKRAAKKAEQEAKKNKGKTGETHPQRAPASEQTRQVKEATAKGDKHIAEQIAKGNGKVEGKSATRRTRKAAKPAEAKEPVAA